jgi:hypothetical protein
MPVIDKYHAWFYGKATGPQAVPAQIALYEGSNLAGYVQFHDPGLKIPTDAQVPSGQINMHLPLSMFPYVLDVLRNESPISYGFSGGKAVLGTAAPEPVGEGE